MKKKLKLVVLGGIMCIAVLFIVVKAEAGRVYHNCEINMVRAKYQLDSEAANEAMEMAVEMDMDSEYEKVWLGDYISVYEVETEEFVYMYPIFCDRNLCFVLHTDDMGNMSVVDGNLIFNSMQNLCEEKQYFLFSEGGNIFAASEEKTVLLEGGGKNEFVKSEFYDMSFSEKKEVAFRDADIEEIMYWVTLRQICPPNEDEQINPKADGYYDENDGEVLTRRCKIKDFVRQGNRPVCWAASLATIINYKCSKKVTLDEVIKEAHEINPKITEQSGATLPEMKEIIAKHGLRYSTTRNKIDFFNVKKNINSDKPFSITLLDISGQAGRDNHQITGFGYAINTQKDVSSAYKVFAWDPGQGVRICFKYNDLKIHTNGSIYSWRETMY